MSVGGPRTRVALALLVWATVSAAMLRRAASGTIDRTADDALVLVETIRKDIDDTIGVAREDVVLLAHASAAARVEGDERSIRALFVAYAHARHGVAQVRLLDARGRERVRVEHRGTRLESGAELQDKSERYYFRAAVGLQPDEVFVSRIDLNVEHGRVERPLRPTVRVATPVYEGEVFAGVIVVNLAADLILEQLDRRRSLVPGALLLVDRAGNYVSHPDPERRWGDARMLGTGHGLVSDDASRARWLWESGEAALQVGGGSIAARATVDVDHELPRVLLVVSYAEALGADLGAFVPAIVISAAMLSLIVVVALAQRRQRRLSADLVREVALRREIGEREEELGDAQARLVASARLAALSASAGALAHELRNPLGAIVNSAGLLRADPGLDDDSRALMEIVRSEAERLERAVSSFVDLARPSTPQPRPTELAPMIEDVVELARLDPVCGEGITLGTQIDDAVPAVRVDPDEMRQLLWNLLRNAGSATRQAGGRAVRVVLRAQDDPLPRRVCLDVFDEGAGPASESPEEWPTRGTGVGLIVVAGVVARYGGRFELGADPDGRGAVARVALPIEEQGASE